MSRCLRPGWFVCVALWVCVPAACGKREPAAAAADGWTDTFRVAPANFVSTGRNTYFILEPGYRCRYEGKAGHTLAITVLNETKTVDGIETRVVEEREFERGALAEVSRNYFAVDKTTHDVYYFGEDVDEYEDGKVTGHGGSWLSGKDGARYGLMMPAAPKVGARYYQELAPGVAMDRAEVVSLTEKMATKAGAFESCLKTEESSALESGKEFKTYAPGVGLVQDADLKLVECGEPGK